MTGILLCLAALIVLSAALWLVLCREALVAAVWFKVFPTRSWYPPEAAEAPEGDPEPVCGIAPRVVAGSDLDRHRRPIAAVNADFAALIDADPNLASLRDLDLSAYYVTPEGDR